ncbi:enoyl-CoA hydratase/isomerase family protein [Bordetella sp. N]|uniref:enoyl-CoA hydratase/isomerase family protein n=1 Tax=Bordetella sp. N TaxID=1746199 RepID=UPI00070ADEE0|nr:enoyl-CoA hydratase-related protein [Bordetella sp. N]ALM83860.1 enoyl-CoA hydratase [Bordetella sp. N]
MSAASLPEKSGPGCVRYERDGGLAFVTLDHPGRMNAITVAMWRQLAQTFAVLSADLSLRCVIVAGAGGNFAAGADIREFPHERRDLTAVQNYHRNTLAPALKAIADCPHPVVASIEGVCVGGGLEIASQCDLRIAATSARFGVPINRLGFPMAPDEMRGLLTLAGRALTLELLLEGRIIDAAEAFSKGLLTRVVADAELAEETRKCASRILRGAPLAARINKRTLRRLESGQPLEEKEYPGFFAYADSHDHQEGVRAFLAGEEPTFSGD